MDSACLEAVHLELALHQWVRLEEAQAEEAQVEAVQVDQDQVLNGMVITLMVQLAVMEVE